MACSSPQGTSRAFGSCGAITSMGIPGWSKGTAVIEATEVTKVGVWTEARVVSILSRTPSIKSFFFEVGSQFRHIAGQHMVVRLTDADGYSVMRKIGRA